MKVYSVLIVDDNREWRIILTQFLGKENMFMISGEAGDGKTAIRMIEAIHPDIIIIDMIMPECNGSDVLEHLRQIPEYNPFIYVITGFGTSKMTKALSDMEVDYYSLKPVDPRQVVQNLKKLIIAQEYESVSELRSQKDRQKIEEVIYMLLRKLGAKPHLLSTKVTCEALLVYLEKYREDPKLSAAQIYNDVAGGLKIGNYKTVERNIRFTKTSITAADSILFRQIFAYEIHTSIPNMSFITLLGNYIWNLMNGGQRGLDKLFIEDLI